SGIAAQPETAYVLAALDLAEESPNWAAVLDRLKSAAAGESNPGRARGALVYAFARSGDMVLAKTELDKVAASPRPYALLPDLRAFVSHGISATPEVDAGKRDAAASASAEPHPAPEARPATEGARAEGEGVGGDYRSLLQQA